MRAVFAFGLTALVVVACKGTTESPTPGTCKSDDECTFSCQPRGTCCHNPYCETPALAAAARTADAYNREHCTKSDYDQCPQIGSRAPIDYRLELHCRSGACVADKFPLALEGDATNALSPLSAPPAPGAVDVGAFTRACSRKEECRVVEPAPCGKCRCPSVPIALTDLAAFDAAAKKIDCTNVPKDERVCGECRGFVADCQAGACIAKPKP